MVDAPAEPRTGAEDIVWDLSVYYDGLDDPQIESDIEEVHTLVDDFVDRYRGRVADLDPAQLATAYRAMESIYEVFARIYSYASLNFSVYSGDSDWGAFQQRATELNSQIDQKIVFFDLEINEMDDEQAQAFVDDPAMSKYAYHLESTRMNKPYKLSEDEEKLLIEKNVTGNSAWVRFFTQITSSIELDFDGEKLPMSRLLSRMYSSDRDERRKAADVVTAGLDERKMELTYIFNTLAADKASTDRIRGYESWIKSRNISNKVSDDVVEALIEAVTSNYDLVARHYDIKRRLLGYDELYEYDRYAPLNLKESDTFYKWDRARQIVTDAYSAFSPQIGDIAGQFFSENWIHAPAKSGKRGGAYASYGTKNTHPWVFMNFTGTASDVMTLAHELGHGVHMYLAGRNQTLMSMYTPLTTAEMASVFGEMVVFQDLMSREDDDEVKLSMLAEKIDSTFATVYRQISMNRFEEAMHTARREEGELSTERFNELWMETQNAMFEGSVTLRDEYAQWWSYIPHFLHTPGYVYAYAFGELLVLALYNIYQETGEAFVPKYIDLLSAGDSDYPEKLLAEIGVDLEDPNFWTGGIEAMTKLVDREEDLATSLYADKF
jgi:oligoendopeptidase F